ncbi:unnamed protein product [Ectocarpus sp. 12 AP-2014]
MRSAIYALHLGVCLLAGQACAFVRSPSGRAIASVGPKGASRARAGIVMQATSNVESSVSRYKKLVGAKRWETDEGIEKRAASTFAEMCKVYGEDNAVQMVKNSPACLGYDGSVFRATFEAFTEVFGEEETKGMVTRNPNLLAVRPTGFGGAANAKSDTMQMSYVIAATRQVLHVVASPLGPVLLFGLAFCLAIPLVEIGTGISREQILSAIISGGN